jgi:TPR repeat protein
MVADATLEQTRTKSLATHLIKHLLVITTLVLAAPVLADDKQAAIDECYLKYDTKDYNSAFPACKQVAEQGNALAQYALGLMFHNGQGTPKDDKQAIYWYTKSAEQGSVSAQLNLGVKFVSGQGTLKDDKQAVYWYTKSAEQGLSDAQFNLGFMFRNGLGTPVDDIMAYVWWNVAAAQGDENAKKNRDFTEKNMTSKQIAEAQKLSKEYYAKYVK